MEAHEVPGEGRSLHFAVRATNHWELGFLSYGAIEYLGGLIEYARHLFTREVIALELIVHGVDFFNSASETIVAKQRAAYRDHQYAKSSRIAPFGV